MIKVVFEVYIKWCENGLYSSSVLQRCGTVYYLSTEWSKHFNLIIQSIFKISWGKSGGTLPSSLSSMLNSLLWSARCLIFYTHDPMQNPGYFINQIRSTWVDPDKTWPSWPNPVSTLIGVRRLLVTKQYQMCKWCISYMS